MSESTTEPVPKSEELPTLSIDGEVLSGRLFLWADTFAITLSEMADRFDAIDPLVAMATGRTAGRVLRDLAVQLAKASVEHGGGSADPRHPDHPGCPT